MMLKTLLKKSTASTQAAQLVLSASNGFRLPATTTPSRFFSTNPPAEESKAVPASEAIPAPEKE